MNVLFRIAFTSLIAVGLGISQANAGKLPDSIASKYDSTGVVDGIIKYQGSQYGVIVSDQELKVPASTPVYLSASSKTFISRLKKGQFVGLVFSPTTDTVTEIWVLPNKYKPEARGR